MGLVDDSRDPDRRDALSERMAEASRTMQGQTDDDSTYIMAAQLAVDNVEGCDAASLSIVVKGRQVETRGASHDQARQGDLLQYDVGEGPCLDAVWDHLMVTSPSLVYDQRWPTWGPRVVEETGFHSILSFRLFSHADRLGSLNMYGYRRNGFGPEDQADGLAIAAHIAVAVTASQQHTGLETALGSRTVIGQATGILIERYGLRADVAFATLVRAASAERTKVRDLATELVHTGRLRGVEPGE